MVVKIKHLATIWEKAEASDLLKAKPTSLLAIYAHGKALIGNPYGSRLLLKDSNLTIAESSKIKITACRAAVSFLCPVRPI